MTDLHAAITARLDDLERVARAATPGPWRGGDWSATFGTLEEDLNVIERAPGYGPFPAQRERDIDSDLVLAIEDQFGDEAFPANVAHVATWDPATVLRGLAEDRDILSRHERLELSLGDPNLDKLFEYLGGAFPQCLHGRKRGILIDSFPWPCADVLSLARRLGVEAR